MKEDHTSFNFPLHAWGSMLIAFTIPSAKKIVPVFILLLGFHAIWSCVRHRRIYVSKEQLPLFLLAALFMLHVIGMGWSDHPAAGWNEIGIKSSFLAFPLIAWLIPAFDKKQFRHIRFAFVLGCLAFIVRALAYGLYRAFLYDDAAYLSYQQLGLEYHPTYAATYQAMALFVLMRSASRSDYLLNRRWLHIVVCWLIIVFISMLASKAGLVAAVISIAMGSWCWWKNKFSAPVAVGIAMAAILLLGGSSLLLPASSARIEGAVTDIGTAGTTNTTGEAHSSTELRIITWTASFNLQKEYPFGVGTGDAQPELVATYTAMNEGYAAEKKLNAHNQFLQAGVEHGWPGILLLVVLMIVLLVKAWKYKNILLMNFTLLCGMNFMFESFLEVQAGIVFFCFWVMALVKSGSQ